MVLLDFPCVSFNHFHQEVFGFRLLFPRAHTPNKRREKKGKPAGKKGSGEAKKQGEIQQQKRMIAEENLLKKRRAKLKTKKNEKNQWGSKESRETKKTRSKKHNIWNTEIPNKNIKPKQANSSEKLALWIVWERPPQKKESRGFGRPIVPFCVDLSAG